MDTGKKGNRSNRPRAETVYKVVYATTAVLIGLSYWSVRSFVVAQEPVDKSIVVSNLTLTLMLFVLLIGACVPTVTRRLFPKKYKVMLVPVAVVMGVCLILLLRTLGVTMRF